MGNTWHCCIFGSLQTNRIHPANSRILGLDDGYADVVSFIRHTHKKHADEGTERTPCPLICLGPDDERSKPQKHHETSGKLDNEDKEGDKQNSSDEKDNMEKWLADIVQQNALLPSYLTFNNKRHLSMRSKFTDMLQKMNYCNVIPEDKEDEDRVRKFFMPKKKVSLPLTETSSNTEKLDWQLLQFSVRKMSALPVLIGQLAHNTVSKYGKVGDESETFTPHVRPLAPLPPSLNSDASASSPSALSKPNSKDESASGGHGSSSDSPQKPFQISSNWLDEDFRENMSTDPKHLDQNERAKSAMELSKHSRHSNELKLTLVDVSQDPVDTMDYLHYAETEGTMPMESFFPSSSRSAHDSTSHGRRFFDKFMKRKRSELFYCTDDVESTWQ